MKAKQKSFVISLILVFLLISPGSFAKIWRVNNNPGISTDFTTAQAAHDGASPGDTLYFESSITSYGSMTANKQLVMVGTGYFLDQNPNTQANLFTSQVGTLTFNTNSSGSVVMGLTIGLVDLHVSNISLKRNQFDGVHLYAGINNISIIQNFVTGGDSPIVIADNCQNILIANNFINGHCGCTRFSLQSPVSSMVIVLNNIFWKAGPSIGYGIFKNNIGLGSNGVYPFAASIGNVVSAHNLSQNDAFGTQNGNQSNVIMESVFTCVPGQSGYWTGCPGTSYDGRWQLKAGSPAAGAGEGGTDCGMFGGPYPYILSGMPPVPSVYYYDATSVPVTNSVEVSVKTKSHK